MDIMEPYLLSKFHFLSKLMYINAQEYWMHYRKRQFKYFPFYCLVKTVFSGQTGSGKTFTMLGKS